jgi:hypothetical protein
MKSTALPINLIVCQIPQSNIQQKFPDRFPSDILSQGPVNPKMLTLNWKLIFYAVGLSAPLHIHEVELLHYRGIRSIQLLNPFLRQVIPCF